MPVNLFQKVILNRSAMAAGPYLSSGIMGDPDSGSDHLIHLLENYAGNLARGPAPTTIITVSPMSQSADPGMYALTHTVETMFIVDATTDWANPPTAEALPYVWGLHYNWLDGVANIGGRMDNSISLMEAC